MAARQGEATRQNARGRAGLQILKRVTARSPTRVDRHHDLVATASTVPTLDARQIHQCAVKRALVGIQAA